MAGELPTNCRPFLPALTLVAIAFWSNGATAILWSSCLGLLLDGLSSERLGVQMCLAVVFGWGLQIVKLNNRSRGVISVMTIVFLVALSWRAVSPFIYGSLNGRTIDLMTALVTAVVEASITAGVAGILVIVMRLLLGRSAERGPSGPGLGSHWNVLTE